MPKFLLPLRVAVLLIPSAVLFAGSGSICDPTIGCPGASGPTGPDGGRILARYGANGNIITMGVNAAGALNAVGYGPQSSTTQYLYGIGIVTNSNVHPVINGVAQFSQIWAAGAAPGDATAAGCACEGFGVSFDTSLNSYSGFQNLAAGTGNLIKQSDFVGGYNFAGAVPNPNDPGHGNFPMLLSTTSEISQSLFSGVALPSDGFTGTGVLITQTYGPSLSPDLFQDTVTITNNSGEAISALTYRRTMDWDIPPGYFNEFSTIQGVTANLGLSPGPIHSNNNGFCSSNPLDPCGELSGGLAVPADGDFSRAGPGDQGANFDFQLPNLAAGQSTTFNIYYGATTASFDGGGVAIPGSSAMDNALLALAAVNANVYSLGQWGCNTNNSLDTFPEGDGSCGSPLGEPATYIFGFGGVGGAQLGSTPDTPNVPFVPEPQTYDFPALAASDSGEWFDPPMVDTFQYSLSSGFFTGVKLAPGFAANVACPDGGGGWINEGAASSGSVFDLVGACGSSLSVFRLTNIGPLADAGNPLAFPTQLFFTGGGDLTMQGIPEPATYLALGGGLILLGTLKRKLGKLGKK